MHPTSPQSAASHRASASRRDFLKAGVATTTISLSTALSGRSPLGWIAQAAEDKSPAEASSSSPAMDESTAPKTVAAIVTEYFYGSHGDVLVGKILEGWEQTGGPGPRLKVASMHVEQLRDHDISRTMARKHNVPMFDSIAGAITLGGDSVPVDGILCIAEHGEYPWNEKGQHLYPRRRFFDEITRCLEQHQKIIPVFHDKHLGPVWDDAWWMYQRAQQLKLPLMAGSSLPVAFRTPSITVPWQAELESIVGIGYDGLDVYGFHALECYQSLAERRTTRDQGVAWVQCLQGPDVWQVLDDGRVSRQVFEAAVAALPDLKLFQVLQETRATLFLFGYRDGLQGAVFMLPQGGNAVAWKERGSRLPRACQFEERTVPRHPHFAYLLKAIETMFHTGRPTYPVERTLLTGGILDRALTSLHAGQTRLETPELGIQYAPVDYPWAPDPALTNG
jgi:hypothetical protein